MSCKRLDLNVPPYIIVQFKKSMQILNLIHNVFNKKRYAIPTKLVKACADQLVPLISRIINLSLTTCVFRDHYKTAIVKPLIKKPNLDKILRIYRPVSNLSFVSK